MKKSIFTKKERKEIISRSIRIKHTFPNKSMFRAMRYIIKFGGFNKNSQIKDYV